MSLPEEIGAQLRAAREARGWSRQRLAEQTRIRESYLAYIEEGAWDRLPPAVYARGFLRLYAERVGLDPEEILREAEPYFQPQAEASMQLSRTAERKAKQEMRAARVIGTVVLVGLVIGLGWIFSSHLRGSSSSPAPLSQQAQSGPSKQTNVGSAPQQQTVQVQTPSVQQRQMAQQSVPTTAVAVRANGNAVQVSARGSAPLPVVISATTARCWISVEADGKTLANQTLDVGEQFRFEIQSQAYVVLGYTQGVSLAVADQPVGLPDIPGRSTIHLQVTP
ncbi:MAG: helix-turn-helix domain-containing protein [Firmicutes bacterium]|nr:helix-turn-helix domain-containing protein [Bacillota bacterium]